MKYRREIDGLRALAVVPVILFHAGFETFGGGFVGVDVFLVISGYLITSILLEEQRAGSFTFVGFYERRARRILPALFVVLAACLPLAWLWLLPSEMEEFSRSLAYVSVFVSNIFFYKQSGYFDGAAELKPLLHTWSLAVEEQYYILFPLLIGALWKWARRLLPHVLLLIALASLAHAQHRVGTNPSAAFFLLPSRAWELMIGALAAFYLSNRHDGRAGGGPLLAQGASLMGLAMVAYAVFAFDKNTPFPALFALVPTVGTVLIILFTTRRTAVGGMLGSGLFVGIGLLSYSAYLWHQPLFAFARHRSLDEPDALLMGALALAAIVLGYVSWRYVEQPFRRRGSFGRKTIFSMGVGGSVLLIAFAWYGSASGGLPNRYPDADRSIVSFDLRTQRDYLSARFDSLRLKDFRPGAQKKVLVIGDSYAMDLVNAVYETDLPARWTFATYLIPAICGNLYLKEDFSGQIGAADRPFCARHARYGDPRLRALMKEADEIWLVSAWTQWQAHLVAASFAGIEAEFGPKVIVFGRKHLGRINRARLIDVPVAQRPDYRNELPAWHVAVNHEMKAGLPSDRFVDVSALLCGDEASCPVFTADAALISYDGGHLTREGARYLGSRLLQHPHFTAAQRTQ